MGAELWALDTLGARAHFGGILRRGCAHVPGKPIRLLREACMSKGYLLLQAFEEKGLEVAWNQVKVNDLVRSPADRDRLFAEIRVLKLP